MAVKKKWVKGNPNWKKGGESPNPSGRPIVIAEVRELAREFTEEAIYKLVELMRGPSSAIAQRAAEALLNRGWGSPPQSIYVAGSVATSHQQMTEQAQKLIEAQKLQTIDGECTKLTPLQK